MVVIREQRYIVDKLRTCYVDGKTDEIVGPQEVIDILTNKKKDIVDTPKGRFEIISNEDILLSGQHGKKTKDIKKTQTIPKPGDVDYATYLAIERDKELADPIKYWKEVEVEARAEAKAEKKRNKENKRVITAVDTSKVIDKVEERDRKLELAVIPKMPIPDINIMAGTASSSGTAIITPDIKFNVPIPKIDTGIDIYKLEAKEDDKTEKKVEVKVDNDKIKEKKEEADPYDWYINENLRLKKYIRE